MRRLGVQTVLALFLAIATSGVLWAEESAEKTDEQNKGFWVEENSMDLGIVDAGKDAVATYIFHNDTDAEVRILNAKPT